MDSNKSVDVAIGEFIYELHFKVETHTDTFHSEPMETDDT